MKTLHLNLKSKWFEMILKRDKTEEYREIKKHWAQKLLTTRYPVKDYKGENNVIDLILENPKHFAENRMVHFDTITFSNGYSTERPQFEIELKGIEIREGKKEWGAETGRKYFVLKLGEILNDINCAKFYAKILNQ